MLIVSAIPCAMADSPWRRVAYDDAGNPSSQAHLTESVGNWRCPNPGTADEALRTCAFGARVALGYAGLNPKAQYKAKLRWFSDGARELRVKAGDTVLLPSVKLEVGKTVEFELPLPVTTNTLTLAVEHISGSHAIISDIEILSTDSKPLAALPLPTVEIPTMTPRPISVAGCATTSVDLGGTWKFIAKAPANLPDMKLADVTAWKDIQVPGEWVMQGFTVEHKPQGDFACGTGNAAAYARSFAVPDDWAGKKIKLRCDSVYSDTVIYVNGRPAGKHVGCFVPFELDLTSLVNPGRDNFITLSVMNESPADKLSNGSRYACHQLGGITRKIQLIAVPATHLARLHVATRFDAQFKNATLELDTEISGGAADLSVSLAPIGTGPGAPSVVEDLRLKPGHASIPVANPAKWDNEHPNLYQLTIRLEQAGRVLETVTQKVGFRQVEVRGNQLFVNHVPVKLRGVCRHEVHPLTGRADTAKLGRKDAEIFRQGNCNFIRTSHYPPTEEFVEACDELGMFIECEAPFCWAQMTQLTPAQIPDLMTRQQLEMLEAYRNHPSITHWSMGNESGKWAEYFLPGAKLFKQLDPSRPINFSAWTPGEDGNFCDIGNNHYPGVCGGAYPGLQGPGRFSNSHRPVVFDEYCHLNSYNRRELATDPGLRDLWGLGLNAMWENIRKSQGCLGGAIWSGIDDTFFLPDGDTAGYGTWGPIDGWRRPKPEYWHMKKSYSPLLMSESSVPARQSVKLMVENRYDFTDLAEVRFQWRLGTKSGTVKTTAAPGQSATLDIPVQGDGQWLHIQAVDPRGFVADEWQVALGIDPRTVAPVPAGKPGAVTLENTAGKFIVRAPGYTVTFDAATGLPTAPFAGPELMLLPQNGDNCGGVQMLGKEKEVTIFSDACHAWKASAVKAEPGADGGVTIHATGSYTEADGSYVFRFARDGSLTLDYAFSVTAKGGCNPRQIGVVFRLPRACDTLSWRRHAQWSYYPSDHIGRAQGTARAFVEGVPLSGLAGARVQPTWPWSADGNKYGSNDFRSTKMHIQEAALLSPSGGGLRILGDGSQHVRGWVDGNTTNLLVADYTNHGAPPFFNEHVIPGRPLKPGNTVKGTVKLELK